MTYKPRHDFLLVENLDLGGEEKVNSMGIVLPSEAKKSQFVRLKVLAVGPEIEDIKEGNIVLAEKMMVEIDPLDKKMGLIRQEWVHLIEDHDSN